jgi:hypothetical protein
MVVRNGMSRHHLCIEALRRSRRPVALSGQCRQMALHAASAGIRDWTWGDWPSLFTRGVRRCRRTSDEREMEDVLPEIRDWHNVEHRRAASPGAPPA